MNKLFRSPSDQSNSRIFALYIFKKHISRAAVWCWTVAYKRRKNKFCKDYEVTCMCGLQHQYQQPRAHCQSEHTHKSLSEHENKVRQPNGMGNLQCVEVPQSSERAQPQVFNFVKPQVSVKTETSSKYDAIKTHDNTRTHTWWDINI